MKAINKFFYALLAFATVGMVACSKDSTYEPGAPELEGCYDVYFPDAETLETQGPIGAVELDPTEATEFTYTAYRNNTEGEIVVPVTVTANTENKFTVSEIKFLDGEDVAEFKVTLLESEIGVTYTFGLSIDDPQYVKQYESINANSFTVDVTRVKWVDVGVCAHTEDLLNGWYGLGIPTLNVKVQVRADSIKEKAFMAALEGNGTDADLAGIYRMVSPYKELTGLIGGLDIYDAYVVINAQNVNKVYIPLQEVGASISGGAVMIYSLAGYYIDNGKTPTADMYGTIKNGVLTFPVQALLGCPGGSYAGSNTYYANNSGGWTLTVAPALARYELVTPEGTDDGDFTFEAMTLPEGALFYSESQKFVAEALLEKGKPAVNTDDADRNFVEQYGYLYRLPNLYAEGYPIYFGAKLDGTVTLHANYAEQYTGLLQNGYDVMMAIDAKASKFDPETGLLNLVAEFYTYQGEYIIPYGIYNEVISVKAPDFDYVPAADLKSDFTYSTLFTDTFSSSFQYNEWEASLQKGSGPKAGYFADKTAYRVPNCYANGYDLYFVAADEDGAVSVPAGYELQPTGVSIYGEAAYVKILKGTMAKNGVTLSVAIYNAEGELMMPSAYTESLLTYNWLDVQTGTYVNGMMTDEAGNGVPIACTLQNAEDTNIYRITNFWGVEDYHLMFTWDKTTNKCEVVGTCDTGYFYSGLGGNFHACDGLTGYYLMGYDLTWEQVEAQGVPQPSFDPTTNTFTFAMFYVVWEAGKIYKAVDTFTLDASVSEAKWVDYATGSFASIFSDQNGNQFVIPGVKMQNKENTTSYRLYDWLYSETEVYLNFKWNQTTNAVDIVGFNDSGIPPAVFGATSSTNAMVCDVLTYYKEIEGVDATWEAIAKVYGQSMQSYYAPEAKKFVFITCYTFPNNTEGVLVDDTFFMETYELDQTATTSSVSAPVVRKVSSKQIAIKKDLTISTTRKMNNVPSQSFSLPKVEKSGNTFSKAVAEKRSRIVEMVK